MLKFGWSEVSITPDKPIGLAGQFYERVSHGVETPITVTAWAVESADDSMIICSCDLVAIGDVLVDEVRANLADTGIDPSKIIINATHTHTSFVYDRQNHTSSGSSLRMLEKYLPEGMSYTPLAESKEAMTAEEATDYIVERVTLAIRTAWENRTEGNYRTAFGRAAVGMCRRVVYVDGSAKMWGDTNKADFEELEAGNDSGIELLFTYDTDDKLTGVVANISCPSQVMEHRSVISSDYWGKVRILLRNRYGADLKVLGLCAAAGDQCPRDLIRWVEPETPVDDPNIKHESVSENDADPSMFDIEGTWTIGRRVAAEIEYALDQKKPYCKNNLLIHQTETLNLPLRTVTTNERNSAEKEIREYLREKNGTVCYEDSAALHIHAGTLNRYEMQKTTVTFPIEVHFVRFGNIAFATNPFELFLNYGNRIRARSAARQTFLIQLANGSYGYLPTAKAEGGSHYSAYVSSGYTGHEGGELLVRETLTKINGMFAEKEGQ